MKIEPRIWRHTFLAAEDEERLRVLRDTATVAEKKHGATSEEYQAAAKAADDFAKEAEKNGTEVILRTIASRKKMRDLKAAHPPRDDNEVDQRIGCHSDNFPEALVSACLSSPALNDSDREDFLDSFTEGDFELLKSAAYGLHKIPSTDPKELLLSA